MGNHTKENKQVSTSQTLYIKSTDITDWISRVSTPEFLVVNVSERNESFTICAVSRPPNSNARLFNHELNKVLKNFSSETNLVPVGDFTLDVSKFLKYGVSYY